MSAPAARRPPPPFDLVVLTGFLGAGKTTLLNALLRDPAMADTLVLINEFGAIGLDHLLVERVEGDMLLMSSGCLCCTIRGDLVASLEDALRARDNGRMAPFTRVVIETTGLADPAPVLHTIMTHPYLRLRFRLQAVVTLVDALVGAATLDAHDEAVKQVAMADRLVLTKTDLLKTGRSPPTRPPPRCAPGSPRSTPARPSSTLRRARRRRRGSSRAFPTTLPCAAPTRSPGSQRRPSRRRRPAMTITLTMVTDTTTTRTMSTGTTSIGTTPASALFACATRARSRRWRCRCSPNCWERRTGRTSCASRGWSRSPTTPKGRSCCTASST